MLEGVVVNIEELDDADGVAVEASGFKCKEETAKAILWERGCGPTPTVESLSQVSVPADQ